MSRAAPGFRGSSSSPPRGLREAYERIVDEENLAAEESALDADPDADAPDTPDEPSLEWTSYHYTHPDRSRDKDRLRVGRLNNSPSPVSLASRSRRSPFTSTAALDTLAASSRGQDAEREGSDSNSESIISGISSLENGTTDSFARTLAKHTRDQQRVKNALNSNGRIFSKARTRERGSLTTENLQRKETNGTSNKDAESLSREGSVSSDRSDPPIHVPSGWGRKSRKDTNWLSRIREGDAPPEKATESTGDLATKTSPKSEGRTTATRGIDWLAVAAKSSPRTASERKEAAARASDRADAGAKSPPPSKAGRTPGRGSTNTPRSSIPVSTGKRLASVDKIREWEMDDEFTARSLHVSTSPPIKPRNLALNRIREREIEAVKDKAVATNRLGEIRERTSQEELRQSYYDDGKEHQVNEGDEESITPQPVHANPPKATLNTVQETEEPSASEGEGEAIPGTPIVIYKNSPTMDDARRKNGDSPQLARPERPRQDSHELLRRLARATSASPSPKQEPKDVKPSAAVAASVGQQDPQMKPLTNGDTPPLLDLEEKKTYEDEGKDEQTTPKLNTKPLGPDKTPSIAIGGWVETPASRATQADPSFNLDSRRAQANAALRTALDDHTAKLALLRAELDADSTLDSLSSADLTATNLADPSPDCDSDDPLSFRDALGQPLAPAERAQRLEELAQTRMNERLRKLRLSLRDARSGIEGLESRVEQQTVTAASCWACPSCGALVALAAPPHTHSLKSWLAHYNPFPPVYTYPSRTSSWPRLTWFGLLLLVVVLYQLCELVTWYVLCLHCSMAC